VHPAQHLAHLGADVSLGVLALLFLGISQVEQGLLMQFSLMVLVKKKEKKREDSASLAASPCNIFNNIVLSESVSHAPMCLSTF